MMSPDGPNQPMTHSRSLSGQEQVPTARAGANGTLSPLQMGPQTVPAALSATPTLGALLLALKRRWLLAGVLACIAALLAVAAVSVLFPPKYVAQSRLEITSRSYQGFLIRNPAEREVDPTTFRANQMGFLKSSLVLSRALGSEKLKGLKARVMSPEALEKDIKVDFTQGPEIMTVKLSGDSPDELAEVLNAVIQAYKEEMDTRENLDKLRLVKQLEKSLDENQKTLAEKRFNLRKVEIEEDVPDKDTHQFMMGSLAMNVTGTQTSLRMVSNDLSKKKLDLTNLKAQLASIDTAPVSQKDLRDMLTASIRQYQDKLLALDQEISEMSANAIGRTREDRIESLNEKKRNIQNSMKNVENTLRPELEKDLRAGMQEKLEQDIRNLDATIRALQTEEVDLTKELEKAQTKFQALNPANRKASIAVEKMRDDVLQIQKIQDTLASQLALLKNEPSASSKIVVLQSAETPTDMDYSRLVKLAGAGGLGAFGLVLFGVALLEFRSRKVNGAEEVVQCLNLPLVGIMPQLPAYARRPVQGTATGRDLHWQSVITESVDAIRTQLLHAARTDAVTIVMVTSPAGGEGKTSLASQLAASLARSWRKTLLVDGDLRNPAAHRLFEMPLEPGFSEVLRGETTTQDAVKPTLLSRLWLLPAGHCDAHAIQALAQDGVHTTFAQLKEQYDFIVVDSCPVLPVADALLMAQHVDAVIFSVLRDVSRLPALHAAQQKLQGLGVRILGAVIIGTDGGPGSVSYKYAAQANTV
jgi:polysaccharide biosynthesis transport protein